MAKRQTRRSISLKGLTYQRLKNHCDATGKTMSGYVEKLILDKLDELGVPEETILQLPPPRPEKKPEKFAGSHFTF